MSTLTNITFFRNKPRLSVDFAAGSFPAGIAHGPKKSIFVVLNGPEGLAMLMNKRILCLLPAVALAAGCAEKGMFENIHVRPNATLPIGNVAVTDSSLFDLAGIEKNMRVGPDGVLTFVDSTELTLSGPEVGTSLVEIPVQHFDLYKTLPALPSAGGFIDLPEGLVTESFELTGLGGATVDTAVFSDGNFTVSVDGLEGVSGYGKSELRIVVPNLLKDGRPVTLTAAEPLVLGPDYMLVPDAGNRITVRFEGRVPQMAALAGGVDVNGGEINYIAGFFGRKEISRISRTISAGELGDFAHDAAYVRFDRPQVVFLLKNEYNAPLMADIETLRVDGVAVELKPGLAGRLIRIAPQAETRVVIGNDMTVSGSGLTDVLTKDFRELSVDVNTLLNPTAADLGDPDYVAPVHNSMSAADTLGGVFTVELPLDGVLDCVAFDQELEVDLHKLDKNKIDYEDLTLTLSGINNLPLDLSIAVSVREPGSEVSVPLFDDPVRFPSSENNLPPDDPAFRPGVVDAANLISRSLTAEQIDLLLKADKLFLRLTASTLEAAERTSVRIYSPAELDLRIVAGVELDYTVNPK